MTPSVNGKASPFEGEIYIELQETSAYDIRFSPMHNINNLLLFFFWFVLFPFQLITLMLLESYSNRNVPDFLQCKHPALIP